MTHPLSPGWFSPSERVPRKDQTVRVSMGAGSTHVARFVVEHTHEWPSGASFALANGHRVVPFAEVAAWAPDPETTTPPFAPTDDETADETPDAVSTDRHAANRRAPDAAPAIVAEIGTEVARTEALLRLLPADQLDWSPHPDLPSLRILARRLIRIVARIRWIAELDSVEASFEPDLPVFDSVADLVATFHASAASAAEIAPHLTGATLRAPWTLERNGDPVVQMARGEALREFGLRPLVYHQAEIALLLVSMGLPVPHPYGRWPFAEVAPRPWAM